MRESERMCKFMGGGIGSNNTSAGFQGQNLSDVCFGECVSECRQRAGEVCSASGRDGSECPGAFGCSQSELPTT